MGRPLRRDTIVNMDLTASGKKLGKQVGYNKYRVQEDEDTDTDEVVTLSATEDTDNGLVKLEVGGYTVLKIVKHFLHTTEGEVAYELDDEGKIVIDGEVATVGSSDEEENEENEESKEENEEPEEEKEEVVDEEKELEE